MKLFSGPPLSRFAKAEAPQPADFRLLPIARLAAGGRWRVEAMRSYSEPLLLWFTRGQGRITVAGVTRGYGVHNAIFIPAGVMHGFELGHQVHGTALFFGRTCDLPLPMSPQHLRIRDATSQGELSGILDAVQREAEGSRPGHDRAALLHLGLVSVWLERQVAEAAAHPDPMQRRDASRRLANRYAALLERDFRSDRNVTDYASDLGVTPTHLTRVCNRTCGRTAHALLADRKMHEARRLLAETRLPVREIAEGLGFASPAYFTRAFQAQTGRTPSDFRRGA
ncbi:helix-turn-helix domain-containing protein [Frigidibacter oleivorans]|uniref:helix-turn-helix domain-containing protein n=1 Tax=Frigidibacter oleivorans TaxID=2487129 RepID=UPI001F40368C|nr:AraC family transcriptional regulator [Frigidibacter oleivorans]